MNNIRKLFIKNVRDLMEKSNLTQKQLAEKMGISQPTLVPVLSGKSAPTLDKLERMANVLNVDVHELLLTEVPRETPTISSLAKTIEAQATMLDGNEEMLELWNKLDEDTKDVLLKQMRNLSQKDLKKKTKV